MRHRTETRTTQEAFEDLQQEHVQATDRLNEMVAVASRVEEALPAVVLDTFLFVEDSTVPVLLFSLYPSADRLLRTLAELSNVISRSSIFWIN